MWSLHPIDFGDLPGWKSDDHGAALDAFQRQTLKPENHSYKTGAVGIDPKCFVGLINLAAEPAASDNPRRFYEDNFRVFRLSDSGERRGQVTGFYEPVVEACREKSGPFQTPIFKRPPDLVALINQNRPGHLDDSYRFGRQLPDGTISEYHDRAAIQAGAIDDCAGAIAYVEDPVDAFFIHIQGAARLKIDDEDEDDEAIRVTYDGKSGHPFTAIGKLLIDRGQIAPADISMQSIRQWLADNPDHAQALMEENRSYIFFKEVQVLDDDLGPIAAGKVPLTPLRSLAVDRLLHSFSTPIFVSADDVNGGQFNHLMIAQETGTAIVGPARGDIFFGSGDQAGELAGGVNSACDFYLLVPRGAAFDWEHVSIP